jgi:hypothetical protein
MDMGKETIITKGCKLLLDAFRFIGISSRKGFQTTEAYSSLDLTKVKYVYRQSREEDENNRENNNNNNNNRV